MFKIGKLRVDEAILDFIKDTLGYIKSVDPQLHKEMISHKWEIYDTHNAPDGASVTFSATAEAFPHRNPQAVSFSMSDFEQEYDFYRWARGYQFSRIPFAAFLLVHEYRHLLPGGENGERASVERALQFTKATGNKHLEAAAHYMTTIVGPDGWWRHPFLRPPVPYANAT